MIYYYKKQGKRGKQEQRKKIKKLKKALDKVQRKWYNKYIEREVKKT